MKNLKVYKGLTHLIIQSLFLKKLLFRCQQLLSKMTVSVMNVLPPPLIIPHQSSSEECLLSTKSTTPSPEDKVKNNNYFDKERLASWIDIATNARYPVATGYFRSHMMEKLRGCSHENPDSTQLTKCLAQALYGTDHQSRILSLGVYDMLFKGLINNSFLHFHMKKGNLIVEVKGSSGLQLLLSVLPEIQLEDNELDCFLFSDLDNVIKINPYLDKDTFDRIYKATEIIVFQTLSKFKKVLDHMFFLENPDPKIRNTFLNDNQIVEFMLRYVDAVEKQFGDDAESPFENLERRNWLSKNSFMIIPHAQEQDKVVFVEVPFFPYCNCLPARYTPIFMSSNHIAFSTEKYDRNFGLYRLKMNNMVRKPQYEKIRAELSVNEDASVSLSLNIYQHKVEKNVAAEFVDIAILQQNDEELKRTWNKNTVQVKDPITGLNILVKDLKGNIIDLYNMLHVYDCPESKREMREKKFNILVKYAKKLNIPLPIPE